MRTVPTIVSTKDLSYIEDMCNWIYTLSKKAAHFANEVSDNDLKNGLESLSSKLKSHYIMLLNILQSEVESNESK